MGNADRNEQPADPRIDQIMVALLNLAAGALNTRLVPSTKDDVIDAIMLGINILAEEIQANITELELTKNELRTANEELERRVDKRTQELKVEKDKAEAANRAKSTFLATVSHEIRTPLNGIVGMLELLDATPCSKEQNKFINVARSSSNILLSLINDILDISKIEANKIELETIEFNLWKVVEDTVDTFYKAAVEKGISLTAYIADGVPKFVIGDPTRIQQILVNLLGNAIKFTEDGEVQVNIETVSHTEKNCSLRIEVLDTGVGIDEKNQEKIFQAFSQADQSITRKYGGTGLGLYITKRLVQLLGGRINVSSVPGKYTSFTIELTFPVSSNSEPYRKSNLNDKVIWIISEQRTRSTFIITQYVRALGAKIIRHLTPKEISTPPRSGEQADLCLFNIEAMTNFEKTLNPLLEKNIPVIVVSDPYVLDEYHNKNRIENIYMPVRRDNLTEQTEIALGILELAHGNIDNAAHNKPNSISKFLVVDDVKTNVMVIGGMLKKLGYQYDVAYDGKQAVEMAERYRYDLIFMDCEMPVMDGYEATRKIRTRIQTKDNARPCIIAVTAHTMKSDIDNCKACGMDDYVTKPLTFNSLSATLNKWLEVREQAK